MTETQDEVYVEDGIVVIELANRYTCLNKYNKTMFMTNQNKTITKVTKTGTEKTLGHLAITKIEVTNSARVFVNTKLQEDMLLVLDSDFIDDYDSRIDQLNKVVYTDVYTDIAYEDEKYAINNLTLLDYIQTVAVSKIDEHIDEIKSLQEGLDSVVNEEETI